MALLDSEIQRIKQELGYSIIGIGGLPYIGYTSIFEQVIQPYIQAGLRTTSSTAVTSLSPTATTITLASATGLAAGDTLYVDCDGQGERVTLRSISGTAATALFTKTHSGTYSVTQEGGEATVRDILAQLYALAKRLGTDAMDGAGVVSLDKADVVLSATHGETVFDSLVRQRNYWREELASALGIESMWSRKRGSGGGSSELY